MTDHDQCPSKAFEVALQPLDRGYVEVVRWLVE